MLVETVLFFLGAETWKWAKRIYFRRHAQKTGQTPDDLEKRAFGAFAPAHSDSSETFVQEQEKLKQ